MMSIHQSPHGLLRPELRTAFRELIATRTGIRLNDAQVRGLDSLIAGLVTRAGRELTPDQLYAAFSAGERADLFRDFAARVTIGETHFFRVAPQIAVLREMVFPDLLQRRASTRRLSLWSAGCSSGEEPYTLAILLRELVPSIDTWDVRLFATDLSEPALDTARRAVYREWSFRETPAWVRQRYFTAQGDLWQLADAIRQMVRFERVNLVAAPYPPALRAESSLDLILCRNVTIYFNHSVSHELYRRFAASLTPGGWLILGPSDPPPPRDTGLEPVYLTNAIVWRKPLTVVSVAPKPAERESPVVAALVPPPARSRITRPLPNTSSRTARPDLTAPTTPTERLAAIRSQFDAGERDSASTALEQLTRDAPLLTAAHRLVGLLALERGDTATALESLRRATFLAPEDPLAQYGLGRTYRALGDAVRASAALRHARRILAPLPGESLIDGEEALTVDKLRRALDAQLVLLDSGKGETAMTGYVPTDVDADVALQTLTADERTLRARARFFAAESAATDFRDRAAETEMLICRLHDERYALELSLLSAVQPARGLAPLPCTPAFVAGILNVRGTVVAVLDLARGLGLGGAAPTTDGLVLLTDCAGGGGQGQVGLLVHEVMGTQHLVFDDLVPSLSGDPAIHGLADAGIVVLDLAALLGDGRFEVYDEG